MMGHLHFLNKTLGSTGHASASDAPTLADVSLYALVSAMHALEAKFPGTLIDLGPYTAIETWRENCAKTFDGAGKTGFGVDKVVAFFAVKIGGG